MNTCQIKISGMNCGHCQAKVENALSSVAASVEVNLAAKTVSVKTDKPTAELLAALEKAGYPGVLE
ncbi:MAG: hypothetical protein B0D92_01985 [Spirochaeta sp. LUC14_002_19_P3]|nr:MAG: hypothetical protein B0D92_01985 [Spirochaeta sp. LUC14_002_19_P3]